MPHTAETNQPMPGGIKLRRQSYYRGNQQAFDGFYARYNQLRAHFSIPLRALFSIPLRALLSVSLRALLSVSLKAHAQFPAG